MGIVSALFVIFLSVSGLALHHSAKLSLDDSFIDSSVLLDWYDIEVPDISDSYRVDNHTVSSIADTFYFDERRLPGNYSALKGLVKTEFGFVLATSNQLLLLTDAGDLIETLSSVHGVPTNIQQLGADSDGLVYIRDSGAVRLADLDAPEFSALAEPPALNWSVPESVDASHTDAIHTAYAASLLSWERLILDIHSGRVFGNIGVVLVDIMALLFIFMAVTGVWIWSRRRA